MGRILLLHCLEEISHVLGLKVIAWLQCALWPSAAFQGWHVAGSCLA